MADDEEKARQEKIAAARKRVEQMKKKKGGKKTTETKKDESKDDGESTADGRAETQDGPSAGDTVADVAVDNDKSSPPSLAQQSKIRSTSFRTGSFSGPVSPGPLSPDGDTAPEIYRKHVARIEELGKENRRLAKEAADSERRWKKAEEALSDGDGTAAGGKTGADAEIEKLKIEVASLTRQNAQLQQQVSRGSGHRPSVSAVLPSLELQAELDSKTATIESMEIELSKLKTRVDRQETGASSEREQVTALEEKLARAEAAAGKAQRELQDVKRNLERATEKAVREGSERSSAQTRVKTLELELEGLKGARDETEKRAEGLDKKVTTLTTLHKEQDARLQALRKEKEQADKDLADVRASAEKLESENVKLRSRKLVEGGGGGGLDEGVDELENEEKLRLERRIRSLEQELHEVHSGAWIGKRRELEAMGPAFQEVDLTSGASGGGTHYGAAHKKMSTGGIGDFFASGLNALAGGGETDGLLDDDVDFDEEAFRKAQEDEARQRLERIKDIKRSLKHWEGWRMDIVDTRRGGGEGIGDIFDV